MQLTEKQLESYQRDGFLFFSQLFSLAEVESMRTELPALFAEASERRVLERGNLEVRSLYGSHTNNEIFRRLARHPRLVEPAMQILVGSVYVYQFKINAKVALRGDLWEWHQDFVFWQREDGVPEPRLVTMAVFLDEVTEFNGPLMIVPGSHHQGVVEPSTTSGVPQEYVGKPEWIANLTADLKYTIDKESLARLVARGGITAPKGPSGSALFFDCNLAHGSVPNLSPFDRKIVMVTYNRVDNVPRWPQSARPEFLASRDTNPVSPVSDDALLN